VYEPKEVQLMMNDRQWIVASELCWILFLTFVEKQRPLLTIALKMRHLLHFFEIETTADSVCWIVGKCLNSTKGGAVDDGSPPVGGSLQITSIPVLDVDSCT
jgi:hypothetical protein